MGDTEIVLEKMQFEAMGEAKWTDLGWNFLWELSLVHSFMNSLQFIFVLHLIIIGTTYFKTLDSLQSALNWSS